MQAQYERLTDSPWEVIKPFVNWQRKRELSLRDVFDGILWITRTGSQWRNSAAAAWITSFQTGQPYTIILTNWRTHVHAANGHDSPAGVNLLKEIKGIMPTLKKIMADKSYRGTFAQAVEKKKLSFEVPVREEGQKGFVVEAKRWVVERTFAWLNRRATRFFRRTVIDYERTTESAQPFLLLANISRVIWRIDC